MLTTIGMIAGAMLAYGLVGKIVGEITNLIIDEGRDEDLITASVFFWPLGLALGALAGVWYGVEKAIKWRPSNPFKSKKKKAEEAVKAVDPTQFVVDMVIAEMQRNASEIPTRFFEELKVSFGKISIHIRSREGLRPYSDRKERPPIYKGELTKEFSYDKRELCVDSKPIEITMDQLLSIIAAAGKIGEMKKELEAAENKAKADQQSITAIAALMNIPVDELVGKDAGVMSSVAQLEHLKDSAPTLEEIGLKAKESLLLAPVE